MEQAVSKRRIGAVLIEPAGGQLEARRGLQEARHEGLDHLQRVSRRREIARLRELGRRGRGVDRVQLRQRLATIARELRRQTFRAFGQPQNATRDRLAIHAGGEEERAADHRGVVADSVDVGRPGARCLGQLNDCSFHLDVHGLHGRVRHDGRHQTDRVAGAPHRVEEQVQTARPGRGHLCILDPDLFVPVLREESGQALRQLVEHAHGVASPSLSALKS